MQPSFGRNGSIEHGTKAVADACLTSIRVCVWVKGLGGPETMRSLIREIRHIWQAHRAILGPVLTVHPRLCLFLRHAISSIALGHDAYVSPPQPTRRPVSANTNTDTGPPRYPNKGQGDQHFKRRDPPEAYGLT